MYKLIIGVIVLLGASVALNTMISPTGEKKSESEQQAQSQKRISPKAPLTDQMFAAVHASDYKLIDKLLKKDPALVNKTHAQGGTFINCSITAGDIKMMNYLLDHGANPDGNAECGTTGLQLSVTNMNLKMAEVLISRGANVNKVNEDGKSILDQAQKIGNAAIIKLLKDHGAKPASALPKPPPMPKSTKHGKPHINEAKPKGW